MNAIVINKMDGIVINPRATIPGRFWTLSELKNEPTNQNR
jgi:hypothetical protein